MKCICVFGIIGMMAASLWLGGCATRSSQQIRLEQTIVMLGHRNWIMVADSAYPWQIAPGIELITVEAEQVDTVKLVLDTIAKAGHVKPHIYLDKELAFVPENNARGIEQYRSELVTAMQGYATVELPHEELVAKLDAAAKQFKVVVIKTKLALPYTSVFMELDCGYWNAAAEKELRNKMAK